MSDISKNIRRYRKKNGLSQEQLAGQLNVTRQTISNWETDRSYPDLDMVIRLSQMLHTDPNHLLYPPEKRRQTGQPLSPKPILGVFALFFFCMTWGAGPVVSLFQKILGEASSRPICTLYTGASSCWRC